MIDRRIVSHFNWLYFFAILTVSVIGVVTIYSANHARPEEFFRGLYIKQIYWIVYGLIAMLVALALDYRWFSRYAYLIYAFTIIGLGYVLFPVPLLFLFYFPRKLHPFFFLDPYFP